MNQEPIRVLQIVGRMDRGGIETMIMNLYRNMDREKVQFDFLAHYGREAAYNDEIRALGGRIYEMPALKDETRIYYWKLFAYIRALNRFFREHREYRIIHCHMTNTASIYMPIARRYGVTCRISHSHSTHGKTGLLGFATGFLQKPIPRYATDFFACSHAAKHWFYPKPLIDGGQVSVLPNAIDAEAFRYYPQVRSRVRAQLKLENRLVIACIARFRPEKNQAFLMDVLKEMLKIRDDVVILFAGDGPCEEEVKSTARSMGIAGHTRFLGMRTDISDILQAADAFVLPSLWEGLPLTGLEAQACGLHGVVSDTVPRELNVLDMVEFLPLQASPVRWAEALITAASRTRKDTCEEMKASRYDIHTTAPMLQEFYLRKNHETTAVSCIQ